MAGRLAGKKAVVTAAAQGIGEATARAFAAEGAAVVATDINEEKLRGLEGVPGLAIRQLDVTRSDEVAAAAKEIGAVQVLFNCAGFVHQGSILECEEKDWDFTMDLNVKGMYRVIRAFLPAMLEAGGGSIVNMSSIASALRGVPNRFAYTTSKAAVLGLAEEASAQLALRLSQGAPHGLDAFQVETDIIEIYRRINTLSRRIARLSIDAAVDGSANTDEGK